LMIRLAKAVSDEEHKHAAAYFTSIKPRANIVIVETDTVPKNQIRDLFLAPSEGRSDKEPIGQRVSEIPENVENFLSRDTRVRFTAYVPRGSIEKGRQLAMSGDASVQCTACHGADLRGNDVVPTIAGRSPTYLFRQL